MSKRGRQPFCSLQTIEMPKIQLFTALDIATADIQFIHVRMHLRNKPFPWLDLLGLNQRIVENVKKIGSFGQKNMSKTEVCSGPGITLKWRKTFPDCENCSEQILDMSNLSCKLVGICATDKYLDIRSEVFRKQTTQFQKIQSSGQKDDAPIGHTFQPWLADNQTDINSWQ